MKLRELLDVAIFIKEIEIWDEFDKYYTEIDIENNNIPKGVFNKNVIELQVDYGYLGITIEADKGAKDEKLDK